MIQRLRDLWARLREPRAESLERSDQPPLSRPAYVVIGLGNPGAKHEATRHNVGFRVVECLAARAGGEWRNEASLDARISEIELGGEPCLLLEPQTFMNRSGSSAEAVCRRWPELDPATDLFVVYDDLDLPTGRIRLRPKGGGGGHRGMGDILDVLATQAVPRLRFGVGHPGSGGPVIDWVLAPFPEAEQEQVTEAVGRAADAIETALRDGISAAMGQFNASS